MDQLNKTNNILSDILIENIKTMTINFPQYIDVIRVKNSEGGLSSDKNENAKEREAIRSFFNPTFNNLTYVITFSKLIFTDEVKFKKIKDFRDDMKLLNNQILSSTNIDRRQIIQNRSAIDGLEERFPDILNNIVVSLQDYVLK